MLASTQLIVCSRHCITENIRVGLAKFYLPLLQFRTIIMYEDGLQNTHAIFVVSAGAL